MCAHTHTGMLRGWGWGEGMFGGRRGQGEGEGRCESAGCAVSVGVCRTQCLP